MIIGLDVDHPIASLHGPWLLAYNRMYSDDLGVKDIVSWDIQNIVKPECGKKIFDLLTPKLYNSIPPTFGALRAVRQLRNLGHKLYFITTATRLTMGCKYDWLKKHRFLESDREYVEAFDKTIFAIDVLVDDYPGNFDGCKGAGVLFNAPWNMRVDYPEQLRARNWNDVLGIIRKIEKIKER